MHGHFLICRRDFLVEELVIGKKKNVDKGIRDGDTERQHPIEGGITNSGNTLGN